MSAIVVDTSVWIDFLAGKPAERLEDALNVGAIIVPPIVVAELMSGARPRDRSKLLELLEDLEVAGSPFSHWVAVGDLRARLRQTGLNVSTPDAHVAQCALDRDALLFTHDAIFAKIARTTALKVARATSP